ncbi:hypothetical protein ACTXT7_010580 [Hymenolepis weldensis]
MYQITVSFWVLSSGSDIQKTKKAKLSKFFPASKVIIEPCLSIRNVFLLFYELTNSGSISAAPTHKDPGIYNSNGPKAVPLHCRQDHCFPAEAVKKDFSANFWVFLVL